MQKETKIIPPHPPLAKGGRGDLKGFALWITGLPGSGKSTLADEIKKLYPKIIILRMDEFRKIVTPNPTYSDFERDIVYRSLVYLAKVMTEQGHNIIIDATGNLRKWRSLARRLIPKYAEIYLKCPLEICMKQERKRLKTHKAPRGIYKKGDKGWHVPGIQAPYEEPRKPELTIETDRLSVKESVSRVRRRWKKMGSGLISKFAESLYPQSCSHFYCFKHA